MNFIKPKNDNNFIIICEACKAIINFSKEDLYFVKEVDTGAFNNRRLDNITKFCIFCPNCNHKQDVAGAIKYIKYELEDDFI